MCKREKCRQHVSVENNTSAKLELNEIMIGSGNNETFVELSGKPNEMIENRSLLILANESDQQNQGEVFEEIIMDGNIVPVCGVIVVKAIGEAGEVFISSDLDLNETSNYSFLIVDNTTFQNGITDVDENNDGQVDEVYLVKDGLDLIQNESQTTNEYASDLGYSSYMVPPDFEGTHTYKNKCLWIPSDPFGPMPLVTPGAPNARIYWAISDQSTDEILEIKEGIGQDAWLQLDTFPPGDYCIEVMTVYGKDSHPMLVKSIKNTSEVEGGIEGNGTCNFVTGCISFRVGPCNFADKEYPSYYVCPGECITIDATPDCELDVDDCFGWGNEIVNDNNNEYILEVCPNESDDYPFHITNSEGVLINTGEIKVEVIGDEVESIDHVLNDYFDIDISMITKMDEDLKNELLALICDSNTLKDPCTNSALEPTKIIDILNTIDNLSDDNISLEDFYEELGKEGDFIEIVDFDQCPKMDCVLNKVLDYGLCGEILNEFEELEGKFTLRYQYDYNQSHPQSSELNYGVNGEWSGSISDLVTTTPKENCGYTDETETELVCNPYSLQLYNKHFCDVLNPIKMASFMIHETIHSFYHKLIFDEAVAAGIDPASLTYRSFRARGELFRRAVIKKYGDDSITNHHKLMNEHLVPKIAENLWALNNETDLARIDHYKYFAYDLLKPSDEELVLDGYLTNEELIDLKTKSESVNSNIGCE